MASTRSPQISPIARSAGLLAARKQMQIKAMDLEQTLRGLLRGFGLKVGDVSRGKFAARIRELVRGRMLERIAELMLTAREALWSEFNKLHREVLAIVKEDQVCRRLMTVPGVGAVVPTDLPCWRRRSGTICEIQIGRRLLWLDPSSATNLAVTDVTGAITRVGDASAGTALHDAANALLSRATKFSTLKRWAMDVAKRRGMRRAKVVLARKLATVRPSNLGRLNAVRLGQGPRPLRQRHNAKEAHSSERGPRPGGSCDVPLAGTRRW